MNGTRVACRRRLHHRKHRANQEAWEWYVVERPIAESSTATYQMAWNIYVVDEFITESSKDAHKVWLGSGMSLEGQSQKAAQLQVKQFRRFLFLTRPLQKRAQLHDLRLENAVKKNGRPCTARDVSASWLENGMLIE